AAPGCVITRGEPNRTRRRADMDDQQHHPLLRATAAQADPGLNGLNDDHRDGGIQAAVPTMNFLVALTVPTNLNYPPYLSCGMVMSSFVPLPGGLSTCIRPPSTSIRSFSPISPEPFPDSAPPMPLSEIDRLRLSTVLRARILTSEATACLAALVSASATT